MSLLKDSNLPTGLAQQPLLGPIVALNLWTFVMEAWLYYERIPAVEKYKVNVNANLSKEQFERAMPAHIHWPAQNFAHLHEQPTKFYAITLTLALLGVKERGVVGAAWAYVGLRVVHSLIQATVNKVMPRFTVFALSSFTLLGLTVRAAVEVFS